MLGDFGQALLAFGLVLLNGFFVLAEFALVKVRATRLDELVAAGGKQADDARVARQAIARLDDYLSATQLGITLASLALGWIGEPAFAHLFERVIAAPGWFTTAASHGAAVTVAFLFIAFLHILVGELAPKSIAIMHSEKAALFAAKPMRVFYRVFVIPLAVMNGASRALLRLVGVRPSSEVEVTYTEEELRSILGASQERGGFSFHHLLLLENAFDFGELRIRDVMVPLSQTTTLDASRPWPENAAVIAERRLSRYPLVDGPKGKIIGLLHVKSVLMDLLAGRTPDLRRDSLKMPRASQDLLLEAALRKLQKSGEHMGLAVDDTGAEVGMFTLEDIVEELIGDVKDEFEASRDVSISELIRPEAVLLDPEVADRTDLLKKMVAAACEGLPGVDPDAAAEAVLRRERAVPASVAGSVAVPHARVPGLREPRVAFARLREGVDYQAPDAVPVRMVLMILSPVDAAPGTLARFLRRTAGLMDSDFLRTRLLDATSREEVKEILRVGETSASV
jgi:CBS domain containing-hemolysin-like protein